MASRNGQCRPSGKQSREGPTATRVDTPSCASQAEVQLKAVRFEKSVQRRIQIPPIKLPYCVTPSFAALFIDSSLVSRLGVLTGLASAYKVLGAQLFIRDRLQHSLLPLPKTVAPNHISPSAAVDFEISLSDMEVLNALRRSRIRAALMPFRSRGQT